MLKLINIACNVSVRPAIYPKSIQIRCDVSESRGVCPKKQNRYIFGGDCLVETIEEATSEPQEKGNQETEILKTTARDLLKNR